MSGVLQRYDWHGGTRPLGDLFVVHKGRREACCALTTHVLGWELRLSAGNDFLQSKVCKTQDEVLETAEAWKAVLIEKGWQ